MKRILVVTLLSTCLAVGLAHAGSPVKWNGKGQVSYTVVHKFHKVKGTSKFLVVKALVDDSGLQFTARALVTSFDSGNSNRDAHAMEVVDPAHFPYVTVKGAQRGFKLPAPGAKANMTLSADVDLHGVVVTHPIKLTVEAKDASHVKIGFRFSESFTAHKMERPSLMFIAVEDAIQIEGKADLEARP